MTQQVQDPRSAAPASGDVRVADGEASQRRFFGQTKPRFTKIRVKQINFLQSPARAIYFSDVT